MDRFDFNNQFCTFDNYKYAAHPSAQHRGEYVARANIQPEQICPLSTRVTRGFRKREKLARVRNNGDFLAPWAYYPSERGIQEAKLQEISEEQKQLAEYEERRGRKVQEHKYHPEVLDYEQTEVVINEAPVGDLPPDYQGRGYSSRPPSGSTAPLHSATCQNSAPRRSMCSFLPQLWPCMLSCSLYQAVKLCTNSYKCLISGSNAVRDIVWSADGMQPRIV
jgi:hypothetical protein